MIRKNEEFTVNIQSVSSSGFGVCRIDNMVVFVKDAVTGDKALIKIIKTKKNYAVARTERIIEKSPVRIDNDCESYRKCGGCVYRDISYEAECEIKKETVINDFLRIGHMEISLEEFIGAADLDRYRNKAQYPVSREKGELKIGFYAARSHTVTDCENCLLQPEVFGSIVGVFKKWAEDNDISHYDEKTHSGLLRHIYLRRGEKTGEIMVCAVINGNYLPASDSLIEMLISEIGEITCFAVNINNEKTNVILGDKTQILYGREYITDELCGIKVRLSPESFFQVNRSQAERLYLKAREYASLDKTENLLDLYCGAGTIGLSMADKARKVIGVEIVPEAVENAKRNAADNNIENAEFICGDASAAAETLLKRGEKPHVIVVDPPRKGLAPELIETIARLSPERVVYVSCDPATLARDCELFSNKGYEVKKVAAVDMFPRTAHVETVALIIKNQSTKKY